MVGKKKPEKKPDNRTPRYSEFEKTTAIEWIQANPGTASVGIAAKKFGISTSTLRSWLFDAGIRKQKNRVRQAKVVSLGRPKGSHKNDPKMNIVKIALEAHQTDIHLQEILGRLGWPDPKAT